MIRDYTPAQDKFYMPAEWEKHEGCIMIWPERPGSWPNEAKRARVAFREIIAAIAKSETVYVAAGAHVIESAKEALGDIANVVIFSCETDDAWARDMAPTFVKNGNSEVRGVNWQFNAWGGEYNGLYSSWDKDNAFAEKFAESFGYACYDASPFVLEGGSVHSDGEGTVLVTESCLLSMGRNPEMTKEEIESMLKEYLGAEKVIWLARGIYNDETDEHVDNVCCFTKPGEVLLAWTDDENDPQYELSNQCMQTLLSEKDAKGRSFIVHKLPIPKNPILVKETDLEGYVFEDGEDVREVGERLAASYVNFYISNGAVVFPVFGEENAQSDALAEKILGECFPDREIIAIYARDILAGGGNIHCITQQIPFGKKRGDK